MCKINIHSLLVISLLLLASCGEKAAPPPKPTPTLTPYELERSLWPKEIRQEIFGDEETFSTPRIQFTGKLEREDRSTLWSMRLDGSDKRRVADSELLFSGEQEVISGVPVRSPDNRYVVLSMDGVNTGVFRVIIDLKEKTRTKIMDGSGKPNFNWTPDSKNIIFHTNGKLYNYNVASKVVEFRADMKTLAFFLLPDGETFIAMQGNGYWVYDFNGNVIKKIDFKLPKVKTIRRPAISSDGKWLAFSTQGGGESMLYWVDILTGKIVGSKSAESVIGRRPIRFSDEPDTLYVMNGNFYHTNLNTLKRKKVEGRERGIWDLFGLSSLTLFNYQAEKNQ